MKEEIDELFEEYRQELKDDGALEFFKTHGKVCQNSQDQLRLVEALTEEDPKVVDRALRMMAELEITNPWYDLGTIVVLGKSVQYKTPRKTHKFAKMHDVPDVATWKKKVFTHVSSLLPEDWVPSEGMVRVRYRVYHEIPKTTAAARRILMEAGVLLREKTPDWDNNAKSALDALKLVLWLDDNQIVDGGSAKYYSRKPRAEMDMEYRVKRFDK